jgi:hypothetical protein
MQPPLAIIATYNDIDIFPQILSGLILEGICVHVIDNWSSDGTYEAVAQIVSDNRESVSIERFPPSGPGRYFDLRAITRRKEDIAARYPGRWIIQQDSDEVRCSPWPTVSTHAGLRRVSAEGFSAVDYVLVTFRPVDDTYRAGMDPEAHFRFFERCGPGHDLPHVKAWCQPALGINLVESGGHEATFTGRSIYPQKFILKHYPIRNLEQGRRKIFAERLGRYNPEERANGWHVHYDKFLGDGLRLWNPDKLLAWEGERALTPD